MASNNGNEEDLSLNDLNNALSSSLDEDGSKVFNLEETRQQVFEAAREGQAVTLSAILKNLSIPERQEVLSAPYLDSDGQCCPPSVIAARNGREEAVKILVQKFEVDVELTGRVKFDSYWIDAASALWCASGAGHLPIVKLLVRSGADVNHTTKSNSTPLRAACFDGRADIVKFLIEEGKADFNIANKFNNTCLMIAAFNKHLNVIKYLVSAGVDPDVSAKCGATALHFAAETGALDIVQELVEAGKANVYKKNNYGMTPLMAAAEHCKEAVFDYLLGKCHELSLLERIDALELLGASFANDKDHYDLGKCYAYLRKAMEMRYLDGKQPISKGELRPVRAYDNHVESLTLQELEIRETLPHKLHMEGLSIRQRILGESNPDLPHPIIFRGAVFADATDFDKCVTLWLHALQIKQKKLTNFPVTKDILRFAQVFSQMVHLKVNINLKDFLSVLEAAADELESNMKVIQTSNSDDPELINEIEDLDTNMLTFLYLVVLFNKLNKGEENEIFKAMKTIHRVVSEIKPKSWKTGRTLIHLAVENSTAVNDFHIRDIVRFPCAKTAKLLIEAGIDVQSMDNEGNTPLHLIVGYQRVVGDFLTLHGIIMALVDAGAHVDVVNHEGKTAMAKASTGVAEIILKSQLKLSLKCLSAQAVKRHGLSFMGQVPASLEQFISLHGP